MRRYTDEEIVKGIDTNQGKIISFIYQEYYPLIEKFILHHGGSNDQAQDVFQEGMIVIFRKIRAGKLELFCKFSTYLYAVCKWIWIQEKKKQIQRHRKLQDLPVASEPELSYGTEPADIFMEIFEKNFRELGTDCQQILGLYFNGITLEEIRKTIGYKTIHHVSDKKYRCKNALIEKIKNDPLFMKLKK